MQCQKAKVGRRGNLYPEGTHKQDRRGREHVGWVDAAKLRLLAEFLKTVLEQWWWRKQEGKLWKVLTDSLKQVSDGRELQFFLIPKFSRPELLFAGHLERTPWPTYSRPFTQCSCQHLSSCYHSKTIWGRFTNQGKECSSPFRWKRLIRVSCYLILW